MTNEEIYAQGYAIAGPIYAGENGYDMRDFKFNDESIPAPMHHLIVELLDGREVSDINRVREIAEMYKDERV